jgi:membrane associated rhomboid family serine protease
MQHWMAEAAGGNMAALNSIHALKMTPTVGASGAIYGVLMGYAMLYPDSIMTLVFPPISLKAKWFVLIFAGIELLTGVTGTGGGIAHFAHLGGLIFGFLLILYWKKRRTLYSRYD